MWYNSITRNIWYNEDVFSSEERYFFFTIEYIFPTYKVGGEKVEALCADDISKSLPITGCFSALVTIAVQVLFIEKVEPREAEGEYIMANVEKIKGLLLAAYPGCTVKVLTDSWYRGDGPDGYQDEYYIAAIVGGKKVWEHFFADFTYDASGGFEPDPDWERIEADNLRQYCRFSLREY